MSRSHRVSGFLPCESHSRRRLASVTDSSLFFISGLYESILPLVKSQVESQIKVRDFSRATVSISPAEFGSWADARAELLTEAKRPLKAQLEAEMAAAANEGETRKIRAAFDQRERAIEVCTYTSQHYYPRHCFQYTDVR